METGISEQEDLFCVNYNCVGDALLVRFKEKLAANVLIDFYMLHTKANDLAQKFIGNNCDSLSMFWISKWKIRHEINSKKWWLHLQQQQRQLKSA